MGRLINRIPWRARFIFIYVVLGLVVIPGSVVLGYWSYTHVKPPHRQVSKTQSNEPLNVARQWIYGMSVAHLADDEKTKLQALTFVCHLMSDRDWIASTGHAPPTNEELVQCARVLGDHDDLLHGLIAAEVKIDDSHVHEILLLYNGDIKNPTYGSYDLALVKDPSAWHVESVTFVQDLTYTLK
jgi:hypothetical protein